MAVTYEQFLDKVIVDGIAAVKIDYAKDSLKLEGALAGFNVCRHKNTKQLADILANAHSNTETAFNERAKDYWKIRCYESEIEWVCNCLSAVMQNQGMKPIITPTYRGYKKAAEIVGVVEKSKLNFLVEISEN
ncbi:hypothetical protein JXB27_02725 [Candidatus Woesearchaeota archaeon]|nr:hypothetical protein [Candidatus Woesearchaeota archaeon]